MPIIGHFAEDCPKCGSEDLRSYWWQRGQAYIIICNGCEHEAGRERTEHEAVAVWNEEARAALPPAASMKGIERGE